MGYRIETEILHNMPRQKIG